MPRLPFSQPTVEELREQNRQSMPVGTRVRIVSGFVDWWFFRGNETGTVISNTGEYLGITVQFDEARRIVYDNNREYLQTRHGFNAVDLAVMSEDSDEQQTTQAANTTDDQRDGASH